MEIKSENSLTLGVFAKYWQPGQVKTRLAKTIGDEAAAELHLCLLDYLLNQLRELNERALENRHETSARLVLCVSPARNGDEFKKLGGGKWEIEFQSGGDLGIRMQEFFETQFRGGATACVLVGSDCPEVDVATIDKAFEKLKDSDLVLGPALDGGYYLIGMRRPIPQIFDNMPWSGSELLSATISRAESLKLAIALLDNKDDIDTHADLMRWLERASQKNSKNGLGTILSKDSIPANSKQRMSGYRVSSANEKRIDVVRRVQQVLNSVMP